MCMCSLGLHRVKLTEDKVCETHNRPRSYKNTPYYKD